MVDKDILFHFGAARSGTTYFNGVLREYLDYGMCSEGHFITRIGKCIAKYGDLEVDKNLQRLIDDVLDEDMIRIFRTRYSSQWGREMDVTSEDVWRNLPGRSYSGVVYSVFVCVASQLRCSRVGNNCPPLSTDLTQLARWFPRAKFIHLVRDGRDVALSLFNLPRVWAERSAYAAALTWVHGQEDAQRLKACVPRDQYYTLYYERLLQYPEAEVSKLEEFLKITLDPRTKNTFVKTSEENPKRWNFGKWRKQLSRRDLRIYEAIAGRWLERHGYERVYEEPTISRLERVVCSSRTFARRTKQRLCERLPRSLKSFILPPREKR